MPEKKKSHKAKKRHADTIENMREKNKGGPKNEMPGRRKYKLMDIAKIIERVEKGYS
jgi:hypothetical protein